MVLALIAAMTAPADYTAEEAKFRASRAVSLARPRGWLAVSGLLWLKAGRNTVGTDPSSDIVLPGNTAPKRLGVAIREGYRVTFFFEDGVDAKVNRYAVRAAELKTDAEGSPDRLTTGALTISAIKRGNRLGLRVWDAQSPARLGFKGLHWYPIDSQFRVTARFEPYPKVRQIPITNILGDTEPQPAPGELVFRLGGQTHRLVAIQEDKLLFINFQDATNGKGSYPAGRFLYAKLPVNGEVILDFNRATNPPCAYTAFATCPLPPKGNRLPIAIPAGERTFGKH